MRQPPPSTAIQGRKASPCTRRQHSTPPSPSALQRRPGQKWALEDSVPAGTFPAPRRAWRGKPRKHIRLPPKSASLPARSPLPAAPARFRAIAPYFESTASHPSIAATAHTAWASEVFAAKPIAGLPPPRWDRCPAAPDFLRHWRKSAPLENRPPAPTRPRGRWQLSPVPPAEGSGHRHRHLNHRRRHSASALAPWGRTSKGTCQALEAASPPAPWPPAS